MNRLARQFAEVEQTHPEIWHAFVKYTFQLISAGRTHHSARDVLHRIRWDTVLSDGDAAFKINDHWSPFYARKFHQCYPEHNGFFELRTSQADGIQLAPPPLLVPVTGTRITWRIIIALRYQN